MNTVKAEETVKELFKLLNDTLDELRENAIDLANAEHAYRKEKAIAWAEVPTALPKATVPEKTAWVDARCADLRLVRDMADNMRQVNLEAVRTYRTQISSIQSLLSANNEELKLARTGPELAA